MSHVYDTYVSYIFWEIPPCAVYFMQLCNINQKKKNINQK